jgi:hypothetical protein
VLVLLARVQRLCVSQIASSELILVTREMTDLEDEVWDDTVHNFHLILVSPSRKGAPEGVLTRAVPAPAAMWNLHLAKSVGDGATDTAVVALDMSTPQGRRRKKVLSVGINDVETTPTRARLNVLANMSPQRRN